MIQEEVICMSISVVMATYNGSRFLEEQMESIYRQILKVDEVYFSDDGSTDDTISVIQRFIKKYHLEGQWEIHINEKNKGYAKNFLDAALHARGNIIFFSDQDDIWLPERIEVMANIMEQHKEINLLCSNLEPFYQDEDTRKWGKRDLAQMKNDGSLERYSLKNGDFHLKRSGCTMCVRKDFLEQIIPYWTSGWAHDEFVWKMASMTNSCAIIQYMSMKRRMHSNNATVIRERTREWRIAQLTETAEQLVSLRKYAQDNKISEERIFDLIEKNKKAVELRTNVLKQKNIISWVKLWCSYKDCYPRIKGLYLDLYLAFFSSYKGV